MVKVKRVQSRKTKIPQTEKKFCAYLHRRCTRPRINGHLLCMTHILANKDAPFQRCSFIHPISKKRCAKAAPKNDRHDSWCSWHMKQSLSTDVPKSPSKKESEEELDRMLGRLESYCSKSHNSTYDEKIDDQLKSFTELPSSQKSEDNFSDEESIKKPYLVIPNDIELEISSDEDEPLKHAGVYTYEEAAKIYKEKLICLQSLYIEEMKCLQYFLSENRRDYLKELRETEKRSHGSIFDSIPKSTNEEREQYLAFQAVTRYHRVFGQEALLREKSLKRRLQLSGTSVPLSLYPSMTSICNYIDTESGACKNKALPLTKYCLDHILLDNKQVLFHRCPGRNSTCTKVIVPFMEDSRCVVHSCPETSSQRQDSLSPIPGPSGLQNPLNTNPEQEQFQSMDDIASLGLDAVAPGCLFGLNKFGELHDESTDSCMTYDSRGRAYFEGDYRDNVMLSDSS